MAYFWILFARQTYKHIPCNINFLILNLLVAFQASTTDVQRHHKRHTAMHARMS